MSAKNPVYPKRTLAEAEETLRVLQVEVARMEANVEVWRRTLALQQRHVEGLRELLAEGGGSAPVGSEQAPNAGKYPPYKGKKPRKGATAAAVLKILSEAGEDGCDPADLIKLILAAGHFGRSGDLQKSLAWELYSLNRRGFPLERTPGGRWRLVRGEPESVAEIQED